MKHEHATGRERGRSLASYYRHDPSGNVMGRRFYEPKNEIHSDIDSDTKDEEPQ